MMQETVYKGSLNTFANNIWTKMRIQFLSMFILANAGSYLWSNGKEVISEVMGKEIISVANGKEVTSEAI